LVNSWPSEAFGLNLQAFTPEEWLIQGFGDFNGDGMADLIWRHDNPQASDYGTVVLWEMNGPQKLLDVNVFDNLPANWHLQGVADFNADGKSDLLWRSDSGIIELWQMDGKNIIADNALESLSTNWHFEAAVDYDGDNKSDILWRHRDGDLLVWKMDGAQKVAEFDLGPVPNNWTIQSHHYDIM
jgi:hypothetical protein